MANSLRFQPLFHVDLHFHVLSALDLPGDAASVFSGRKRPWSEELKAAYLAAPGRLMVHGVPLLADDFAGLLAWLRGDRLADFCDEAGRKLAARLADLVEGEAPARQAAWDAEGEARARRQEALTPWLAELEAVFAELWGGEQRLDSGPSTSSGCRAPSSGCRAPSSGSRAPSSGSRAPGSGCGAPPIDVHDCPSLATRAGTHGRSMLWSGRLHLALGLGGPLEQVLCQLIHEATHAVTDPPIRAAHAQVRQDTRVGSAAFSLHRELERAAVEEGARLVAGRAPRLRKGYDLWRRRHGC
ncbi:MAG TPA: hypothetical protein VGK67_02680 [Myxococcales bacterium]